ncbi:hypothetical protein [Actinorugispora endophytica]|uniref:Uncharacterized protein n=1 Tax=Actinorugispora endophytica TaxID=1605990 RepID=A0A4V3D7V6_9ACTN|nr:hypothetical protein [Actinorugispora endophytica]TDQ49287.1 hypothetical protein EV190_11684 [Actinorugispora endophytica]
MTETFRPPAPGAAAILLRGLVDDAGLFPPTALPMGRALARHRADRTTAHPMLAGRFLCPVSRWAELCDSLGEADRIDVGLILDTEQGLVDGSRVEDPRVRVTHYETRAPGIDVGKAARYLRTAAGPAPRQRRGFFSRRAERPDRTPAAGPPVYFEFDRGGEGRANIAGLAGAPGLGAKVRCGGADAELFPGPEELSEFIAACAEHGVPFKATAGLHHAVRHTDPTTGFTHFGYLNLLLATAMAVTGDGPNRVRRALVVTDPDELVDRVGGLDEATAARTRELFVGYGSCSTRDPVADAEGLGLLEGVLP